MEQQREKLKNYWKKTILYFHCKNFFDKCILLENRRSEFAYLSGLQDGIEFTKKIEQVKRKYNVIRRKFIMIILLIIILIILGII